jgi:ABC-type multidrug transport system fused ATPase/permease subunit
VKLNRLGELASVADYWRNQTASLLFANLARMDQAVRQVASDFKKVLDSWNSLLDKVRQVKSTPKVAGPLEALTKLSSFKNPWRLMSSLMGFIAIGVLFVAMYIFPENFLPITIVSFIVLFALMFYSTFRVRKLTQRNIEAITKYGGAMIEDLSQACKDLAQTVVNILIYELPKRGRASDTYTLKLLSGDYSNTKLRVQEKVKKGKRTGDLYSIVWK